MKKGDRRPLPNAPSSGLIRQHANNRYGAVLSSLYGFWNSRQAAAQSASVGVRGDAYSFVTFGVQATVSQNKDGSFRIRTFIFLILPDSSRERLCKQP